MRMSTCTDFLCNKKGAGFVVDSEIDDVTMLTTMAQLVSCERQHHLGFGNLIVASFLSRAQTTTKIGLEKRRFVCTTTLGVPGIHSVPAETLKCAMQPENDHQLACMMHILAVSWSRKKSIQIKGTSQRIICYSTF